MSLTGLHTNYIAFIPTYKEDRDFLLKIAENDKLLFGGTTGLTPYYDGSIAIGYGFDLLKNPIEYVTYFLGTIGITLTQTQKDQIGVVRANLALTTGAQRVTNGTAAAVALGQFLNLGSWSTGEPRASALLRNVLDNNSGDVSVLGKELQLNAFLLGNQIALPDSREKAVLVSMWYQAAGGGNKGGYFRNKDFTITNMVKALQNDDRAEVWYQIRYGSSKDGQDGNGVVQRRFFEADYFGLYDAGIDAASMNDENALGAFRAYTRHSTNINNYESRYASQISAANSKYGITIAQPLTTDLQPARNYLTSHYALGIPITGNIVVGENNGSSDLPGVGPLDPLDTRYYRAGTNNQYAAISDSDDLYGTDQNDLIFGESGNDYINSLGGSDVLYGGRGNDTYIINTNNTGSFIEDKDGTNTVVMNGVALKVFYKDPQSGFYQTPDQRFRAERSGTDLVVTDTTTVGNKVTFKDFAEGDFGIRFKDLPAPAPNPATDPAVIWGTTPPNPPIANSVSVTETTYLAYSGAIPTVTYSPTPPDSRTATTLYVRRDLVSSAVSTDPGGGITTVNVYNYLYRGQMATMTFNDSDNYISGDAQTTQIYANGGDDWIDGSRGNATLIEAGTGSDVVYGGSGDDQLYAGTKDDLNTAFTSGACPMSRGGIAEVFAYW